MEEKNETKKASSDAKAMAGKKIIDEEKEEKIDYYVAKKIDFRFELALFLILGFLLGVVIKTEAVKRITIGFNDSLIPSAKQSYDFGKIEEQIAKESEAAQQAAQDTQTDSAADQNGQ